MIFQSLIGLYDRLGEEVPPPGFSMEDIGFAITIDQKGHLVGEPEDLRIKDGANYNFRLSEVPYTNQVNVRTIAAATTPNFMVDKASYVFGMWGRGRTEKHHDSFRGLIEEVCEKSTDPGVLAVKQFLSQWNPADSAELPLWDEICGTHGKWVAFRLQGNRNFVHEHPEVRKLWKKYLEKQEYKRGVSFTDGCIHDLQSQYAQFPFGSGASLVSFNERAYESYGKKRGENAPISVAAEFKSSAALKYLLRAKNKRRIRIGDATTVFWAERVSPMEGLFGAVMNPAVDDEVGADGIKKFLEAAQKGSLPNELEDDGAIKFYILGLSLNKARLALRFWHVCSVAELMNRLVDHFDCLAMERSSDKDIPYPGIWHLLKETARETKDISPVLGGALTRSILTGGFYPQNLYQGVLGRIRADHYVNYLRASILKAVLKRNYKKELPMSLDVERRETAYLLGRLFAVLEKAQLDALGKINSTIKDRFFSAASATPASVFPRLLRLSQHHIEKADYGYVSDRRISEIMEHLEDFPTHMGLKEQGMFSIAYYQQKNAIYAKKDQQGEDNG